jgi:glycosyltransferase involved in cell wall biosynthesis
VANRSQIAVFVKGYPRLSETFIAQEILGLQQRGLDQLIVSLRRPTDPAHHDLHDEIKAPVVYLPEYLKDDPKRVAAGRRWAQAQPTYHRARAAFDKDLARERSANRWRRWGQACVIARELPASVGHIHVHFLHTPASVVRYAALMRGLTWSFSAHAKDIWTSPDWELAEKIDDCAWGVTCTAFNTAHLKSLARQPDKVTLVYHGLDLDRFPGPKQHPTTAERGEQRPIALLSVGRAVEKKGYDDLICALARLPRPLNWTFSHIGGGELLPQLAALAQSVGIADRVMWLGAQSRDRVIRAYEDADIFVLASRITGSGDRDGLPNVLMEAQAVGVACIATNVSAIPELIDNGRTGLLVTPRDISALAAAIEQLIRDPRQRQVLAAAGAQTVRSRFSCQPGIDAVADLLRKSLALRSP